MKFPVGYVPGVGLHKATAYGGLGEKLLKNLGWKEGQGLGVEGTGITTALKVIRKEDTLGVGGRQDKRQREKGWWEEAFNSAALSLATGEMSSSDSDASDAVDTDTPPVLRNRDGTVATGTKEELRIAKDLAKDPWGRFGGHNGKLARLRQQEAAMAAALSAGKGTPQAVMSVTSSLQLHSGECDRPVFKKRKLTENNNNSNNKDDSATYGCEEVAKPKQKQPKKRAKREYNTPLVDETCSEPAESSPAKPKRRKGRTIALISNGQQAGGEAASADIASLPQQHGANVAAQRQLSEAVPKAETKPSWWGASRFVSSGCLEGLDAAQPAEAERKGFTEDSQADLYNKTQASKTAGKKGLGRGQGKSADHEWQGSRVVFEDADTSGLPNSADEAVTIAGSPRAPWQQQPQRPPASKPKIKLKKLSKKILEEEADRKMKLSRLTRQISALLSDIPGPLPDLQAMIVSKLGKSDNFRIKGKTVWLIS